MEEKQKNDENEQRRTQGACRVPPEDKVIDVFAGAIQLHEMSSSRANTRPPQKDQTAGKKTRRGCT